MWVIVGDTLADGVPGMEVVVLVDVARLVEVEVEVELELVEVAVGRVIAVPVWVGVPVSAGARGASGIEFRSVGTPAFAEGPGLMVTRLRSIERVTSQLTR
jgi:hypothetical protein